MVGVIAVALTKRKVEQVNESAVLDIGASFIVFYSFSDPSHIQVWKLYNKQTTEECSKCKIYVKRLFVLVLINSAILISKESETQVS